LLPLLPLPALGRNSLLLPRVKAYWQLIIAINAAAD
jgi:hypothetical protein